MNSAEPDRLSEWTAFLKQSCRKQIGELGREYPHKRSLYINYRDVERFGTVGLSLADEIIENPGKVIEDIKEAIKINTLIKTVDSKPPKDINIRFSEGIDYLITSGKDKEIHWYG